MPRRIEGEEITDIPVRLISGASTPSIVGRAIFEDTKNIRIEFIDHELVGQFNNLSDQQMIISVSFEPVERGEALLDYIADRTAVKSKDI